MVKPASELSMASPLRPFRRPDFANAPDSNDAEDTYYSGSDMVDIESLGYTYEAGSLEELARPRRAMLRAVAPSAVSRRVLMVTGIDRAFISGSFIIRAVADTGNKFTSSHVVF